MALEDLMKGDPGSFVALGIAGLAVPYLFPALRPQVAAVMKSGAKLFVEAEFGADNEVLNSLVDSTIDRVLNVTATGSNDERAKAGEKQVRQFMRTARARSRRRGSDDRDRERRFKRHLHRLDTRLRQRRTKADPSAQAAIDHVLRVAHGKDHPGTN